MDMSNPFSDAVLLSTSPKKTFQVDLVLFIVLFIVLFVDRLLQSPL